MYSVGPFRGSIVSSSVSDFFAKVFINHDFSKISIFSTKFYEFGDDFVGFWDNFRSFHFFKSFDIENEARTQKYVSKGF